MSVLVKEGVRRTLFTMAFPMLAGTFAMNAYSLTDAWFIAQLGTHPLAAMGFTLPVIMLLTFVAGGLGTGITTLVSHAIGRHDHEDAAKLVTHGLALTLMVTAVMTVAGYLTIDPVFRRLGADETTLPLVGDFMRIWYLGEIGRASCRDRV
jgi:Na+-driven multidrug efflux pump